MPNDILYPDYNNSILNITMSILKNYNLPTDYNSLNILDKTMDKKYKNIVLLILDGLGTSILNKHSNGFLSQNKIADITSVCPSTTTSAMTTYYSAKPPSKTGWLAWSQYFKEYGRTIDLLGSKDSYTKENFSRQD